MSNATRPLEHTDERKEDDALRREARAYLASSPPLQLVAELLIKLRGLGLAWWSAERLRQRWPAQDRMKWLRARPDLRQQITTQLTGLAKKAARKKGPDFQAALVDSVIDEGDISTSIFEDAFEPADLVVYGPADAFWRAFIEVMPYDQESIVHQELFAWLLDALLASKSGIEGLSRRPILTPLEVRSAIGARVWATRVPIDVRVAIDDARMARERERPTERFLAVDEIGIATSAVLASAIPARELVPVLEAAERAMGFTAARAAGPRSEGARSETAAAPVAKPDAARADAPVSSQGPASRAASSARASGPVAAPPPSSALSYESKRPTSDVRAAPPSTRIRAEAEIVTSSSNGVEDENTSPLPGDSEPDVAQAQSVEASASRRKSSKV